MAGTEKLEECKQYLRAVPENGGVSLYDHMTQVLVKLIHEKPSDANIMFEDLSAAVRASTYAPPPPPAVRLVDAEEAEVRGSRRPRLGLCQLHRARTRRAPTSYPPSGRRSSELCPPTHPHPPTRAAGRRPSPRRAAQLGDQPDDALRDASGRRRGRGRPGGESRVAGRESRVAGRKEDAAGVPSLPLTP